MQTLLVTVDSLRADHLEQYGYERSTMPVLDRLAGTGTVFENAFSNGPYTRISIPAFQTSQHLAYEDISKFPTVASTLSDAGVQTTVIGTQTGIGLISGDFNFDETIDLGRDEYHEQANRDRPLAERVKAQLNRPATKISKQLQRSGMNTLYTALKKPYNRIVGDGSFQFKGYTSAEVVTDRALSWLESNADSEFFLWVHYMEAHRPYGVHNDDPKYLDSQPDTGEIKQLMKKAGTEPDAVSEADCQLMRDLYDSDIEYCSRHIERLFDGMERLGIWADSNVLFSSDHGEEFREHGHFYHRNYPYDELIHVPLIVKSPETADGERIAETRELLDLAPTIASFHMPDTDVAAFRGRHLFEEGQREVFVLGQPQGVAPTVTLRTDDWKYMVNDDEEKLYDLTADPQERTDVVQENPDVARQLREEIPPELIDREAKEPRDPEDEVDREQLEALGYMELRE